MDRRTNRELCIERSAEIKRQLEAGREVRQAIEDIPQAIPVTSYSMDHKQLSGYDSERIRRAGAKAFRKKLRRLREMGGELLESRTSD